jgi:Phospholipase_D-nuclease N-terminal
VRIIIGAVLVLFLILWARAVIDVFRRHDLSGGGEAGWTIFMLILPFIGLLVYTMLRPANV